MLWGMANMRLSSSRIVRRHLAQEARLNQVTMSTILSSLRTGFNLRRHRSVSPNNPA